MTGLGLTGLSSTGPSSTGLIPSTGPGKRERLFRPSGADTWINCHGSIQMSAGMPSGPSSGAAREGTAAHKIAELCLRNGQNAGEYIDRSIDVEDGGKPIFFEEADTDAIQLYLDTVRSYVVGGAELHIEVALSLLALDPSDAFLDQNGGTADAVIADFAADTLTVVDLKFGRGVPVAKDAYQLKDYGLIAIFAIKHERPWKKVRTVVVQPRLPFEEDRIKIVEHEVADLMDFAMVVYHAMIESGKPNAPLTPGEKQCRWCRGRSRCTAIMHKAATLASDAFKSAGPIQFDAAMPLPVIPNPVQFSPQKVAMAEEKTLAQWLELREVVKTFLTAVEQRAVQILESGGAVPGYKLVSRSGNRKWIDPDVARAKLVALGMSDADINTEPKMKSPAQIEKVKINGVAGPALKKTLESLYEKPEGAPTLVRETAGSTPLPPALGPVPKEMLAAPVIMPPLP